MRLLPEDPSQGWTRYVWLVYCLPLFIQPVITGRATEWLLLAAVLALFLPLYFIGYWLHGGRVLFVVAALVVLGCLYAPHNSAGAVFFIYAAGPLGAVGPPAIGARYVVGIVAVICLTAWFAGIDRYAWAWSILFTLLVGGINIHFAEVGRNQAKLRLAHEEVERLAATAERERIARDLHDVLGHTLSLITLKSGLAARIVGQDAERAEVEMRQVEQISRDALHEVRRAVEGYRFLSLGAELTRAKVALAAAGVESSIESGPYDLSNVAESAAALALREAVTNIVRHARAAACTIRFGQRQGIFDLVVIDDGCGGEHVEGHGLVGMRERVEALGGTVAWEGENGTRLTVRIPLAEDPSPQAATG